MSSYGRIDDPYCYTGNDILQNEEKIQSAAEGEVFEVAMLALRSVEPPTERYGDKPIDYSEPQAKYRAVEPK